MGMMIEILRETWVDIVLSWNIIMKKKYVGKAGMMIEILWQTIELILSSVTVIVGDTVLGWSHKIEEYIV